MLQVPEARRHNGIRACGERGHAEPTMGVAQRTVPERKEILIAR